MSKTNPWGYRPALDGIRAVAVYLVVVFHAGVSSFPGGFVGVDLFFVLSGYLVTNVLLSEMREQGTVRLRRFYARRVRRLLPAAHVVIVAVALMWLLVAPLTERLNLADDARAALLYYANWHFLFQSQDYFAAEGAESPYLHFWSLAIEEQYYFVYPLVLIGLFRLRNRLSGPRASAVVPAGVAALLAVSLGLQVVWAQVNTSHAYYGTDARLYQLLAGCLLALVIGRLNRRSSRGAGVLAGASLAALLVGSSSAFDVTPSVRGIVATVCSVGLIASVERSADNLPGWLLSRPTIVYLGNISYGTYLWHWPVVLVLGRLFDVAPWVLAVLTMGVATALASLSAQVLERPIRSRGRLDAHPVPVVAVGMSLSVILALLLPTVFDSPRRPAIATGGAAAAEQDPAAGGPGLTEAQLEQALRRAERAGVPEERDGTTQFQTLEEIVQTAEGPVPSDIDWEALGKDSFDAPTCAPDSPSDCTLTTGSGTHVLLVGDSTARTFIPMLLDLAEERDLTVTANVRQACAWFIGSHRADRNDREACTDARDRWYETAIPILQPDLIVLAQRSMTGSGWADKLRADDAAVDALPLPKRLVELGDATLDVLESFGVPIVVVEPVAAPIDWNPIDCLSGARLVRECAFTMPGAPEAVETALRRRDDSSSVLTVSDLDATVCPLLPTCTPYLDSTVLWRDGVHVTTSYWELHRDEVWEAWAAGLPRSG